ncbi:HCO3 transporter family-domain-containing protein [Lipomyces tetrasporus]
MSAASSPEPVPISVDDLSDDSELSELSSPDSSLSSSTASTANEAIFSSALAAMVFSILGAQPLTIVGITGLISLFNYTIYDIITQYDPSIYPQFMCWTAIWAAIFHWLVALWNMCDYTRYATEFSSESFGMYVGIIYIVKGVEELVSEFSTKGSAAGYLSSMIAILYSRLYMLSRSWDQAPSGNLGAEAYWQIMPML